MNFPKTMGSGCQRSTTHTKISTHSLDEWQGQAEFMTCPLGMNSKRSRFQNFTGEKLPTDPPRNSHLWRKFFLLHLLHLAFATYLNLIEKPESTFKIGTVQVCSVMEIAILVCEWKLYPVYSCSFLVSKRAT